MHHINEKNRRAIAPPVFVIKGIVCSFGPRGSLDLCIIPRGPLYYIYFHPIFCCPQLPSIWSDVFTRLIPVPPWCRVMGVRIVTVSGAFICFKLYICNIRESFVFGRILVLILTPELPMICIPVMKHDIFSPLQGIRLHYLFSAIFWCCQGLRSCHLRQNVFWERSLRNWPG